MCFLKYTAPAHNEVQPLLQLSSHSQHRCSLSSCCRQRIWHARGEGTLSTTGLVVLRDATFQIQISPHFCNISNTLIANHIEELVHQPSGDRIKYFTQGRSSTRSELQKHHCTKRDGLEKRKEATGTHQEGVGYSDNLFVFYKACLKIRG